MTYFVGQSREDILVEMCTKNIHTDMFVRLIARHNKNQGKKS